jgi:hypothetical protein
MGVQRTWSCWGGHSSSGSGVGSRWADALLFLFRNLIEDSAIAAIVWREREREREESCSCSSVKIKQFVPPSSRVTWSFQSRSALALIFAIIHYLANNRDHSMCSIECCLCLHEQLCVIFRRISREQPGCNNFRDARLDSHSPRRTDT